MTHPDSTNASTNASVLHREIFEQPAAMRRALEENRSPLQSLITRIKEADIRYVVLAARGTSDNAATYAKYLLQITCGIPVALAAPSVHTLYNATVNYKNALVIGVSQSGAGEDINEVMTQARKSGALTVAITNTESSNLAKIAEHVLLCHAGEDLHDNARDFRPDGGDLERKHCPANRPRPH
jgi:glutamine---fructose-6-phosphate transaminase (isomerizing)